MIVEGQGATSMWYEDGRKKTFEWQQGSVFAIPPNVWHEHYAMSAAARLVSCTSAPLYMQLFNNDDFIFNCDYKFIDRYAEEENYFVESPKLLRGFKGIETNFVAVPWHVQEGPPARPRFQHRHPRRRGLFVHVGGR